MKRAIRGSKWIVMAAALLMAAPAVASKKNTQELPEESSHPGKQPVDVAVPQSDLSPSQGTEAHSVASVTPLLEDQGGESTRLEAMASSWVPGSLTLNSRLAGASAVQGTWAPSVSLAFLTTPVARVGRLEVSILGGFSFASLTRSGVFAGDDATPSKAINEDVYVSTLRLGAAARFQVTGRWYAFADVALAPAGAFTTRTIFDDGTAAYGLPIQGDLGIANDLGWISSGWNGILLKAGIDGAWSAVTINNADFTGVGAEAGLSFPL